MNQNGFSTGEEDSRGPLDKICCLQEDGFRCQRQAGNASYSKKIRNTVRQLKLHLDAVVCYVMLLLFLCILLVILFSNLIKYIFRRDTSIFVIITRI